MRAWDKKKLFRLICKQMVRDGKMPNSDGQWVRQENNAGKHICAGHGTGGRKR